MKTTHNLVSLTFKLIPIIMTGSVISNSHAATITAVGVEEGSAGNNYSVQNWSNAGVAKSYDLGGTERYGTAGYYQIRPMAWDPGSASIGTAVGGSNNLGISEGSNPTLYSAPTILSSLTGAAGTYVNYGGYSIVRGPDGSSLYRAGGLSVSVGNGAYNTPSGSNTGYFGEAFSFTMGMSASFRMGIAADTVASGSYAPDYMSIFNSSTGSVFSSQISRNGSMDMAFFDIDAAAGDTFSAAMWQLAGTQSVVPFSLVTFDVSQFKFDAGSGNTTSSSTALAGAAAGLSKTGAGTVSLTANNTYGGATTVGNGTLELGEAGRLGGGSYGGNVSLATSTSSLRVATSANQTLSGVISGNGSLAKSGNGTLTLSGSNSYTGNTTVSAGTVIASNANALGDVASAVTVNSGGTLDVRANMTRNGTVTIDAAALTGGGSAVTLTNNGSGFELKNAGAIAGSVTLTGTGGLTVNGARSYIWNSGHTYTGATVIAAGGDFALAGAGALSSASAVNNSGVLLVNNKDQTLGGLSGASTGRVIGSSSYSLTVNKASGTDTYNGTIESVGALIKEGNGTLALAGNNTYAGNTTVNAGRIQVSNSSALGSTAGGTTVASGAQLRLNAVDGGFAIGNEALTISGDGLTGSFGGALRNAAGNNTWGGKISLAGNATIGTASGTTLTMDVASGNAIEANNFNLTFDGAGTNRINDGISLGNGGLTKIGTGTTILAGNNSYTGATVITLGTLQIGAGGTSGSISSSSAITNNGTLAINRSDDITLSNNIDGTGSLTKSGAGKLILSGTNTYTGITTVSAGTLAVNGSVAGEMTVATGSTLQGSGSIAGNTTVSGNLNPGNSPGLLTFENSLTLDSTSTTTLEITGLTRGSQYDAVDVAGLLTYGGSLIFDFSGSLYDEGVYSFNLFDFAFSDGSFGNVSLGGIYGGSLTNNSGIWDLTDGDNSWSFNQDDGVLSLTVVPEPSVAMLAGSVAMMALMRRRRATATQSLP